MEKLEDTKKKTSSEDVMKIPEGTCASFKAKGCPEIGVRVKGEAGFNLKVIHNSIASQTAVTAHYTRAQMI